jgi:alpha-tubulin suppressor-like RCC1 family protein
VAVFNLPGSAVNVTAGGSHTCVIRSTGGASCWGENFNGQLGTGSNTNAATPRSVSGLSGTLAIAAGDAHTCALVGTGVRCWGANFSGQLGDGTNGDANVPRVVSNLTNAASVAAGGGHSCARTVNGSVRCWGENIYGQLGDGSTLPPPPQEGDPPPANINSNVPRVVLNLSPVLGLAGGADHGCATLSGGSAACWGRGSSGQLGDGNVLTRSVAFAVPGITSASTVAAGDGHSCVSRGIDQVSCWGDNSSGQIGANGGSSTQTPVAVTGL